MTHIGFIMDGNRRWAKQQGIPERLQHEEGAKNLMHVVELCQKRQLEVVSFWALAVKNIQERSETELTALYALLKREIQKMLPKLQEGNIRFEVVGDMSLLPDDVVEVLQETRESTCDNTGMTCILAIAYGGQREILRAVQEAMRSGDDPESLDEQIFASRYLDSGRFAAPDLIIRTGCSGRQRTSGFLLWGSEYSELYFTDTYWPAFGKHDLEKALTSYRGAQRNFGA